MWNVANPPKVTVVIPNFNYEDFILQAVYSVLNQDYKTKVVIVDDCSTDNSWTVISTLKDNDRVKMFRNETTLGPSATRNKGIKHAWETTDIFGFLDSDDVYRPGKISKSIRKFLVNPEMIGVVYSDYDTLDTRTGVLFREFKEPYSRERLMRECIVNNDSLVSKLAFQKAGLYDEDMRVAEDYDLWVRISEHMLIEHIAEALVEVRTTGHGATFSVDKDTWNRNWRRIQEKTIQRHNAQKQMRNNS